MGFIIGELEQLVAQGKRQVVKGICGLFASRGREAKGRSLPVLLPEGHRWRLMIPISRSVWSHYHDGPSRKPKERDGVFRRSGNGHVAHPSRICPPLNLLGWWQEKGEGGAILPLRNAILATALSGKRDGPGQGPRGGASVVPRGEWASLGPLSPRTRECPSNERTE